MLTREQAIEAVGREAVVAVEKENCEPTCRAGFNGYNHGDTLTEWSASVDVPEATLFIYYYTDAEQDQILAENGGDGSMIDWQISHYDVV